MTKPYNADDDTLIFDIESAGVNALYANLGYLITFGYITLGDFLRGEKWKTLSIGDYPEFKKDPHNDYYIVKESLGVIQKYQRVVFHYGKRFDEPFLRTRAAILNAKIDDRAKLITYPEMPYLDTCHLAYKTLRLSSNRLKVVAEALGCKWQKLDKKDGWPKWWMAYLKGNLKYEKQMNEYCGYDVMTLAEITDKMRPYWPQKFVDSLGYKNGKKLREISNGIGLPNCEGCGSDDVNRSGKRMLVSGLYQRYACRACGRWFKGEKLNA